MLNYKEMRNVLKKSRERIRLDNFTADFYAKYCEAYRSQNWTPVFFTDFYNVDGGAYCVFQEEFNATLPKWKVTLGVFDHHYPVVSTVKFIRADTEDNAKETADRIRQHLDLQYADVERVTR